MFFYKYDCYSDVLCSFKLIYMKCSILGVTGTVFLLPIKLSHTSSIKIKTNNLKNRGKNCILEFYINF